MQMLGGLGVRGQPRLSETSSFDRAHRTSYSTLIETTVRVYLILFSSYSAFSLKVVNFNPPHLHSVGISP